MDIDWKHLFFGFQGRISRAPYWIGSLLLGITGGIAILGLTFNIGGIEAATGIPADILVIPVFGVIAAMIFCSLAISVKRLHDRNKSGWWMALFYGVSALQAGAEETGMAGTPDDPNALGVTLAALSIVVGLWFLVELGFLKGTPGDNDYGPDPLNAAPRQQDASF
jgi:uncharacterized membrane protein YhaH (DUF805 family)